MKTKSLLWDTLQRKGWEGPSICQLCTSEAKTVLHLFVKCPFTRQVWDRIKIEQKINSVWEGNSLATCYEYWAKTERNFLTLSSLVCWFVSRERNKSVFENGNPSVSAVVYKTLVLVATSTIALKVAIPKKVKIHLRGGTLAGWFDGAAQSNGLQIVAGGILRITENSYYTWTFNCGQGTNTRVALLGVWATLNLAARINLEALQIFGDSKIIIDWLNCREKLQVISLFGLEGQNQRATNHLQGDQLLTYLSRSQQGC